MRMDFVLSADAETWTERIERALLRLEALTGTALVHDEWSSSGKRVARRSTLLQQCLKKRWRQFSLSNGVSGALGAKGYADAEHVTFSGVIEEYSGAVYVVHVSMQFERPEFIVEVIREVGAALGCFSAQLMPQSVENALRATYMGDAGSEYHRKQAEHIVSALKECALSLPPVNPYTRHYFVDPRVPFSLGWINYWSRETCEYLQFPDLERDTALLRHSFETADGAWIVRLSDEVLDLHNLDHLCLYSATSARIFSAAPSPVAGRPELGAASHDPQRAVLLRFDDIHAVAEAIRTLASAQGHALLPADSAEPAATALRLRAGTYGWIQIDSENADYFLHSSDMQPVPRFVALCEALQCAGLAVTAYSEEEITAFCVDPGGDWTVSGHIDADALEERPLHEHALSEEPTIPDLSALDLDVMDTNGTFDAVSTVLHHVFDSAAPVGNDAVDFKLYFAPPTFTIPLKS